MLRDDDAENGSGFTKIPQRNEELAIFILEHINAINIDVWWQDLNQMLIARLGGLRKCPTTNKIIKHPNVKAFVTQGGIQSTDEAITAAVPLVGVPMLADQWYNVEKYEQLKIGVKLDIETITDEKFKDALMKVIDDKSYRENIVRVRTLMRDQPTQPLERAVWWTEHVLRHSGASHLRAPAAHMHWTRYYELKLVLTVLSVLLVTLFLCLFTGFKIYSYVTKHLCVKSKLKLT